MDHFSPSTLRFDANISFHHGKVKLFWYMSDGRLFKGGKCRYKISKHECISIHKTYSDNAIDAHSHDIYTISSIDSYRNYKHGAWVYVMPFDPNGTFYTRIDAKSDTKRPRKKNPLTNPNSDINMTGNSVMADKTQPPRKHEFIGWHFYDCILSWCGLSGRLTHARSGNFLMKIHETCVSHVTHTQHTRTPTQTTWKCTCCYLFKWKNIDDETPSQPSGLLYFLPFNINRIWFVCNLYRHVLRHRQYIRRVSHFMLPNMCSCFTSRSRISTYNL